MLISNDHIFQQFASNKRLQEEAAVDNQKRVIYEFRKKRQSDSLH